jgi:uncharacterized membrane protein YgdD (TMEM256/DUF423 family)
MINTGFWLRIGAVWGFLAVSMGAFGAHGLQGRFQSLAQQSSGLSYERLQANFQTAAQYHMYGALALLAVGCLAATGRGGVALQASGWLFLLGSLTFAGSLYVLSVTGLPWLGAITPIGGALMLAGWLALAVAAGFPSRAKSSLAEKIRP